MASARSGLIGDFAATSTRPPTEDGLTSHGPSLGTNFGATNPGWNGGIWGKKSTLGGGFAANSSEPSRTRDESQYLNAGSTPFEGKTGSGSLVASSETDAWSARQKVPWNTGEPISPALSNAHIHEPGTSPMRRNGSQHPTAPLLTDDARSTSPFFASARPGPIGPGPGLSNRSPHKAFLDPTSTTFAAPRGLEERPNKFPTATNGRPNRLETEDEHFHRTKSMVGQLTEDGSDLRPLTRDGGSTSAAVNSTLDASVHYQQFPGVQSNFSSTSRHSHNNSSFSSQNSAARYDASSRNSHQGELIASMDRFSLDESRGQALFPQMSGAGFNGSLQLPAQAPYNYGFGGSPANAMNQPLWMPEDPAYSGTYTPEGYPEGAFADQFNGYRPSRLGTRDPVPSLGGDYRRGMMGPFYSTGITPPTGSDQFRAPSRGGDPRRLPANGHSAMLDKKLRGLQQQEQHEYMQTQPNQMMMRPEGYRGQFPNPYEYSQHAQYKINPLASYLPVTGPSPAVVPPRAPSRDLDASHGIRSILLEEFRTNTKSSKRYDLKDIYDHIVEFSGDQHGSRFIQQKLETANSDEKDQVFREIRPNSLQLMTDVFGNYVIQKFFEHGTQQQKTALADQMKGHVLTLSLQMYGCRVVQKALEHILVDQQASLIREIDAHVLKCVKDQNGNHVIQKAIERVPPEHIQFILNAFTGQVHALATHAYGCRVIQRMLEHCEEKAQASILQELHTCASALIQDQYGNYVTQHVIEHGKDDDRAKIIKLVTAQVVQFSKHKFASNVVEKSVQFGTDEQRREIVTTLTAVASNGVSPLQPLMRDQYGNYVIQKLLGQMKGADYDNLVENIKPQLAALKKYAFGKQITAIEKLIGTSTTTSQAATPPPDSSATATPPMLTMDAQSPQSSSVPSTNNSTVDGLEETTKPKETDSTEEPTLTIESGL
ncbi:MAG: hypothetical protein M1825_003075 [Sarcosagium campestre]|nr:MAG: hypothetical protein M1825_003075 [Sarcosagium campestre]